MLHNTSWSLLLLFCVRMLQQCNGSKQLVNTSQFYHQHWRFVKSLCVCLCVAGSRGALHFHYGTGWPSQGKAEGTDLWGNCSFPGKLPGLLRHTGTNKCQFKIKKIQEPRRAEPNFGFHPVKNNQVEQLYNIDQQLQSASISLSLTTACFVSLHVRFLNRISFVLRPLDVSEAPAVHAFI